MVDVRTRVGINGFGRTGRAFLRIAQQRDFGVDVVAVNDLGPPEALAKLLRRDSVFGPYRGRLEVAKDELLLEGRAVRLLNEPNVSSLPWAELGVDVVVEATGRFTARDRAALHLEAGAARVVVSAPSAGADATFVMGINDHLFDPGKHLVVSNASCTTNCLAVLANVLDDAFGIEEGLMSTVHAYTGDQQLVDSLHKDPRRARAAAVNIVPTTTGAARATGQVIPNLAGHLDGLALRVPVPDGSLTDLVALVRQPVTVGDIQSAYRDRASDGRLAGRLEYADDDLVSSDIVGSSASCVYDAPLTMVAGPLVKVLGWYDNEWGYASRLVELVAMVGVPVRT
jgi:glyceraldehyde 3-phosphate dehydrogenase